jgi:hypothetical protein
MFETIYRWFIGLFGYNLAEHLSGWDVAKGDYVKTNLFSQCGIIALISAALVCVTYYYIINHPRFNRLWSWAIMLGIVAFGNFAWAFYISLHDVVAENISSDIADISWDDCFGFGLTNFIVSAVLFVAISLIISLIIKWGRGLPSSNCKYSPFIKF